MQETAIKLICEQQQGRENTAPWMVGEQLKEICKNEPASAELIAQDLQIPEMSIEKAERKIEEFAKQNKTGSCGVVPPNVAEEILRKFYGLSHKKEKNEIKTKQTPADIINILDFL